MSTPQPRRRTSAPATVIDTTGTAIDAAGASLVPAWLERLAAVGWRVLTTLVLAGVVAATIATYLSTVAAAILVGVIVAATFAPIDRHLRLARHWPRGRAAAVTSLIALAAVIVTVLLVELAFLSYAADVVAAARNAVDEINAQLTLIGAPTALVDLIGSVVRGVTGWLSTGVADVIGPIANVVTVLVLGGFLTFYLLEDGDRAWAALTGNLDQWRKDALTARGIEALAQIGNYLRGTAIVAVTAGITRFIFLTVLGVPFAAPLAVLAFLSGFVPYLGPIFATIVLSLVTLATRGPLATALLLAMITVAGVGQNRLLARYVYGSTVRVHPAIVLVVICIGATLFGIGGVFAAVPVGAAIGAVVPALIEALGTRSDARPIAGLVPVWLDRLGQWSWRALVVLALAIVVLRLIVVPIFSAPVVIAIVIACAMKPSADRLRARGFSPTRAALALTLGTASVITAVLVITLVSVVGELSPIVAQASSGASRLGIGAVPVELVGAIGATLIPTGLALLRDAATAGVVLVAAALLTFFFLRDGAGWWARLLARVPADRRTVLGSAGSRAAQVLNGSTIGTGVVALFGAAAQWLTMTVLGLPLAFPIAVLTFFGGFIPYIGTFITTGLGFLVAVAAGDPIDVAVMAVFTLVLNIVQGNFVAPLVYGRTVHLHPAVVLLAAPIGAAFGGIVGMIVVVPIFGIVAATWRSVLYLFDPGDQRRAVLDVPSRTGDGSQEIDEVSVATARKEAAAGP